MDTAPYYTLEQLLGMIEEPQRSVCQRILSDNFELFKTAKGSSQNHQAWLGGYWDHVVEAMNIAVRLYSAISETGRLGRSSFSLSEALVVLFMHDVEKPWKYVLSSDGKLVDNPQLASKDQRRAFRDLKIAEYGLVLNSRQQNALLYVEGEFTDYSSERRAMWPLAAFCHSCDVLSARLWPEYPRSNDNWSGAQRISDTAPIQHEICQTCGSAERLVMKNFDARGGEGDLHCPVCGEFVRMWDPN